MRAKAKQWVKYNNIWYKVGDIFDIKPEDEAMLKPFAEIEKEEVHVVEVESDPVPNVEPAKRGRKRKTNE